MPTRFAVPLRRLALFDYVINNADRKSGHCPDRAGRRRLWSDRPRHLLPSNSRCAPSFGSLAQNRSSRIRWKTWRALPRRPLRPIRRGRSHPARLLTADRRAAMLARVETLVRSRRYPAAPAPAQLSVAAHLNRRTRTRISALTANRRYCSTSQYRIDLRHSRGGASSCPPTPNRRRRESCSHGRRGFTPTPH